VLRVETNAASALSIEGSIPNTFPLIRFPPQPNIVQYVKDEPPAGSVSADGSVFLH
jgi:hypothetical protein